MKYFFRIGFLFLITLIIACQSADKPVPSVIEKIVLPKPFKNAERIEVRPGLIFDVFSWSRGADSLNAILILRSDSSRNNATVHNFEIDGKFVETFNTDMDTDGNPEIIISTKSNNKYNPAEIYCFEYSGTEPDKIRFPDLTSKTKNQYKGNDKFYIKDGKLMREFDLFEDMKNENAKPVERKVIQYSIRGNSFDLTEIENKK